MVGRLSNWFARSVAAALVLGPPRSRRRSPGVNFINTVLRRDGG